jgi:hypothetical protein
MDSQIPAPYMVKHDRFVVVPSARHRWISDSSSSGLGEAIMTPSRSSPAWPSCGWTADHR